MPSVLVIEDDEDILDVLCDLLQDAGYRSICLSSVREAVSYLETCLTLGQPLPRVALLDLQLPGEPGRAFLDVQGQRPELAGLEVYVMSASVIHLEHFDGYPTVRGMLRKPFDVPELLGVLARYRSE